MTCVAAANLQVFKFCKSKDMKSLVERGSVRIGTLFDWRKQEKYGEMAADQSEGITQTPFNIIFYDHRFINAMQIDSRVWVDGDKPSQIRHFKNEVLRTPNLYTFSTSATYSEEIHKKWFESEGYDACYRINSTRLFSKAISRRLASSTLLLFEPVLYFDELQTNQELNGTFHPAMLKKINTFGGQHEVRGLWQSHDTNSPIEPVVIGESDAWKYCEEYRVLPVARI